MPFNADGSFSRVRGPDSWKDDATATTPIRADYHDINDQDLANGLSDTITRTGKSQPTADIPMNNHKLVNVGQPADPQDAATKRYVDEMQGWPNSKSIGGADVDGRLNFTSATGANGITWSNIGAALLARIGVTDKKRGRLAFNNAVDGSGTDVVAIDENDGALQFPTQMEVATNLYRDYPNGTSYRTPAAGIGGLMRRAGGVLALLGNSVATTLADAVATLEQWFVLTYNGSVTMALNKKASGDTAYITGQMGGVYRWIMQLGSSGAEAPDNSGSDFALSAYSNAGAFVGTSIIAYRKTGKVNFPMGLTGILTLDNGIDTVGAPAVLGGVGGVYLRPNGRASTTGQTIVTAAGDLNVGRYVAANGYAECAGINGTPNTGQIFNFNYVDSTHINVYLGTGIVGHIMPGPSFDARGMIDSLMARVAALEARP